MRSSKQRDLVCEIVNLSCSHPTVEEIYEMSRQQIPNISLGTVYRNLNTLVLEKLIRKIKVDDTHYRYDHNKDKHAHFICTKCSNIIDLPENMLKVVEEFDGNKVTDIDLSLTGICKNCLI